MSKKVIVLMLAAVAALAALSAPKAQAQTTSASEVARLRPFSPQANYMSLAGYYRMRVYQESGQWISRGAAEAAVSGAGGFTGPGTGQ